MAKIETYDIAVPVVLSDKLIGTDTTNNETKNFTVGDIINLVGATSYDLGSAQNASNVDVTLTGSDATADTVKLVAGTNITLTDNGSNEVTIASADNDTTYDLGAVGAAGNINLALTGSDGTNDIVQVTAGTNITLTDNGANVFTIDSSGVTSLAALTDTNITAPSTNELLIYNGAQWVNGNITITGPEKLIQTVTSAYQSVPIGPNITQDISFNSVTGNFNTGSVHLHQNNLVPQGTGYEVPVSGQVKVSANIFMEISHASDEITFVIYETSGVSTVLRAARFVSDKVGDAAFTFFSHLQLTAGNVIEFGVITPVSNNSDITINATTEFETEVLR